MRVQDDPPVHLTYCLNVHPGESWKENLAAIRGKAMAVRDLVCTGGRFGLGLRLSCRAAGELCRPRSLAAFRRFLADNDLYVFTINGFPYGTFHATAVKQKVYSPDWRSVRRRNYTIVLADILAELLPEGVVGSISTVPGSYKRWIRTDQDVREMVAALADVAAHLHEIRERTGREICLALEPEPDCFLEKTADAISFFGGPLTSLGAEQVRERLGIGPDEARTILRRHLGVCFDTSHLAVQFENLAASLKSLLRAGIRIGKVHLSSALRVRPSRPSMARLNEFDDGVYLHQVRVRYADGRIDRFADLPGALGSVAAGGRAGEWRVHFHVPLFFTRAGGLRSTSSLFTPAFAKVLTSGASQNVEIETYTFGVLPEMLGVPDVIQGIAEEYKWVLRNVFRRHR